MNKVVGKIIRTCGYLIGFSVLLYPTVSKYVNTLHGTSVVSGYQQQVSHTTEDMENQRLEDARAYNKRLIGASAGDPFAGGIKKENEEYKTLLNPRGDGMMGYIEIPKIKALLPIYHGTTEEVLQSGVGHLESTELPPVLFRLRSKAFWRRKLCIPSTMFLPPRMKRPYRPTGIIQI